MKKLEGRRGFFEKKGVNTFSQKENCFKKAIFEGQKVIFVGSSDLMCSLAYDTYNKYIKWFSNLYLRLILEENEKGGKVYFF